MSFKVTILGSSGALPAYERFPSAQLVQVGKSHFLVDCGEGTQMQLMRFDANLHRINHIFISHLHGDHYLGLMGLIFTMHLMRRTNDLHLYSHAGLDEIITTQFKHSASSPSYPIHFHRLTPGISETIYDDDHLTVTTLPLKHKLKCSGFLFREKPKPRRIIKEKLPTDLKIRQLADLKKGEDVLDEDGHVIHRNEDLTHAPRKSRSFAYCSDTAYHEPLVGLIQNVDLLYHEATFIEEDIDKALETQHSTAAQAATMAAKARAERLIIGHFSARYRDLAPVLDEARAIFKNTHLGTEGSEFTITD